jgi:hypothetical protein
MSSRMRMLASVAALPLVGAMPACGRDVGEPTATGQLAVTSQNDAQADAMTLVAAKAAIAQEYAQERAAGAQNPAPRNFDASLPPVTDAPLRSGLYPDGCDAPLSSSQLLVSSCWYGVIHGTWTAVYAGGESSDFDPSQGKIITISYPSGQPVGGGALPSVKAGSVRIVAAQNSVLTLVSETGQYVMTFDVASLKFTSTVVDTTPPVISGMPAANCTLWPPNGKMVQVADVKASDVLAGVAPGTFSVTGTSSESSASSTPEIVVTPDGSGGFLVQLQAARLGTGTGRTYTLTATATDNVGNTATVSATCTVPHDQGK